MEWVFYMATIIILVDIEEKLRKLSRNNETNILLNNKNNSTLRNKKNLAIEEYLNKQVNIILNDDTELSDAYLFSASTKTIGQIVDYDYEWIVFKYYNKSKKNYVFQYIRTLDIESIDEIK